MSSFSAEWLALREPFDIAARDDELANCFLAQVAQGTQGLQGAQVGPVVDLGAGTGSNISRLRSLAAKLGHHLSWRHVDNDGDLLELARQQNQKRPVATVTPIATARRRRSTAKGPSKGD